MDKSGFVFIFFITFLVIMAWVAFGLVHTQASTPITPQLQDALTTINPNFDQSTLNQVSKLPTLNTSLLPTPSPSNTPSPTPSPLPASTPTPIPNVFSPIATSSGQTASSSAKIPGL